MEKQNIWRPWLAQGEHEAFKELAAALGFVLDGGRGINAGRQSPVQLLESLAAAWRADPAGVAAALESIGVVGGQASGVASSPPGEPAV